MNAAWRIDQLMDRGREATERVLTERDDAHSSAVAALRSLEQRLQEVVSGDNLRGLRDLAPSHGGFLGAAVRFCGGGTARRLDYGIDTFLDSREMLVLDRNGTLRIAHLDGARIESRSVTDEELITEYVEPTQLAIIAVLERHITRAEKSTANYARARSLAQRLIMAVH